MTPADVPDRIGLGMAGLGNLYEPVDDDRAAATLAAAWAAGIRHLDTAPHYGLGLSERRLGTFLAGLSPDERARAVVSTKVGRVLAPVGGPVTGSDLDQGFAVPATHTRVWDFTDSGIRRSLEDSLARLGTDRVDVLHLHDPDESPDPAGALRSGTAALARLRDEGVVDAIGVGSKSAPLLTDAAASGAVDLLLVAGRLTLLEWADDLVAACERSGTAVVAAGVFNSGLLATAWPAGDAHYEYRTAPDDVLAAARELAGLCARHGTDLPTAALQRPLRAPVVRTLMLGASSAGQVDENLARLTAPVPDALWDELSGVPR